MPRRRPPRPGALNDLPPTRILLKILLLQVAYYATTTALILFTALVAGARFSPALILDWRSVRGDTTIGWLIGGVWLLGAGFAVIYMLLIVVRSKLVPDFALTIHFIHLLVTSFYVRAIPTNLLWWLLQSGSSALMISLGMWACRWRELQPISFGGLSQKQNTQRRGAVDEIIGSGEELADRHVRGEDRRGRNVDGGPTYEMVRVRDAANDAV